MAALKTNPICSPSQWLAPPSGCVKINVDAAVSLGGLRVGLGVVARDDRGLVLCSQFTCVEGFYSPHVAEILAAREGILLASKHQWNHVILESDAKNVINSINFSDHFGDNESVISVLRLLGFKFSSFQAIHCRRAANEVAHLLASKGLFGSFKFKDCSPLFISKFVKSEFVGD